MKYECTFSFRRKFNKDLKDILGEKLFAECVIDDDGFGISIHSERYLCTDENSEIYKMANTFVNKKINGQSLIERKQFYIKEYRKKEDLEDDLLYKIYPVGGGYDVRNIKNVFRKSWKCLVCATPEFTQIKDLPLGLSDKGKGHFFETDTLHYIVDKEVYNKWKSFCNFRDTAGKTKGKLFQLMPGQSIDIEPEQSSINVEINPKCGHYILFEHNYSGKRISPPDINPKKEMEEFREEPYILHGDVRYDKPMLYTGNIMVGIIAWNDYIDKFGSPIPVDTEIENTIYSEHYYFANKAALDLLSDKEFAALELYPAKVI